MRHRGVQLGMVIGLVALMALPLQPVRNCCCLKNSVDACGQLSASRSARLRPCCAAKLKRQSRIAVSSRCDCKVDTARQIATPPKGPAYPAPADEVGGAMLAVSASESLMLVAAEFTGPGTRRTGVGHSRVHLCRWLV